MVSLRNGTSGWLLAGLELERRRRPRSSCRAVTGGSRRRRGATPTALRGRGRRADADRRRAAEADAARRPTRPIYAGRRRARAREYLAGHIPGFGWMPGGQAVQRSGRHGGACAPATIVVLLRRDACAPRQTASWYRQMGFANVFVVTGGTTAWSAAGLPLVSGADETDWSRWSPRRGRACVSSRRSELATAAGLRASRAVALASEPSDRFAAGHVPAHWLPRGWLELRIADVAPDAGRAYRGHRRGRPRRGAGRGER